MQASALRFKDLLARSWQWPVPRPIGPIPLAEGVATTHHRAPRVPSASSRCQSGIRMMSACRRHHLVCWGHSSKATTDLASSPTGQTGRAAEFFAFAKYRHRTFEAFTRMDGIRSTLLPVRMPAAFVPVRRSREPQTTSVAEEGDSSNGLLSVPLVAKPSPAFHRFARC